MDGKREITWEGMTLRVRLSAHGQVLHFEVKCPGQYIPVEVDIQPKREAGIDYPTIGVLQAKAASTSAWFSFPEAWSRVRRFLPS